jgi:hypothetical protein
MRHAIGFVSSAVILVACAIASERDAKACGGCFTPAPPPAQTMTTNDITDERMLLSVSTQQTTLYDQIRYSGNPTSFAWVLPIKGTVDVGLSADVLFDSIDALTATTITSPVPNCPAPPVCPNQYGGGNGAGLSGSGGADGGAGGGVTVTKQDNVGPYATVQLHATDSSALETWLADNGFDIPAATQPVIAAYVTEGFDFLAMKLLPNQGVQAMRPVRVTWPGASLSLPLRMAAIGTGATVGITIWVVGDGRYQPQNFPFYHIEDKDLIWDFGTHSSNYTTLRAQNEAALGGKGWEIESSLDLAETTITQVVRSGGVVYGGGAASNASDDYLPVPGDTADGGTQGDTDGGAEGGTAEGGAGNPGLSADQVRDADIAALFGGLGGPTVRVTRMRGDIAHAAMNVDLVLGASSDQSELSNDRLVTQHINDSAACYSYPSCPGGGGDGGDGTNDGFGDSPNGSSGCATITTSRETAPSELVTLAALCAFVVTRIVRTRRRRARKD